MDRQSRKRNRPLQQQVNSPFAAKKGKGWKLALLITLGILLIAGGVAGAALLGWLQIPGLTPQDAETVLPDNQQQFQHGKIPPFVGFCLLDDGKRHFVPDLVIFFIYILYYLIIVRYIIFVIKDKGTVLLSCPCLVFKVIFTKSS